MTQNEMENLMVKCAKESRDEKRQQNALQTVYKMCQHTVESVARNYYRKNRCGSLEYKDLVQFGYEGVAKAIQNYKDKGGSFVAYATWYIYDAINDGAAKNAYGVRLPNDEYARYKKMCRKANQLYSKNGKIPTYEELAEETGIETGKIELLAAYGRAFRNEVPLEYINKNYMGAKYFGSPDKSEMEKDKNEKLYEAFDCLTEREKEILILRLHLKDSPYEDKLSQKQVGAIFGVSGNRIAQIEHKALRKMRAYLMQSKDRNYFLYE